MNNNLRYECKNCYSSYSFVYSSAVCSECNVCIACYDYSSQYRTCKCCESCGNCCFSKDMKNCSECESGDSHCIKEQVDAFFFESPDTVACTTCDNCWSSYNSSLVSTHNNGFLYDDYTLCLICSYFNLPNAYTVADETDTEDVSDLEINIDNYGNLEYNNIIRINYNIDDLNNNIDSAIDILEDYVNNLYDTSFYISTNTHEIARAA